MMGPALVVRNAEFAGAAFANVDDRAVFGDCLPRWEIARFVSTFTRPPATLSVGRHPLLVFPVLSAMRSVDRTWVVVGALLVE